MQKYHFKSYQLASIDGKSRFSNLSLLHIHYDTPVYLDAVYEVESSLALPKTITVDNECSDITA